MRNFVHSLIILSVTLLVPSRGMSDSLAGFRCEFEFKVQPRFPCAGNQQVDGDGIARFTMTIRGISRRNTYRVTTHHQQPAVYTDVPSGHTLCSSAIDKTTTTRVSPHRCPRSYRFTDSSGSVLMRRPLRNQTRGRLAHVFGYSGGSSIPQRTTAVCAR